MARDFTGGSTDKVTVTAPFDLSIVRQFTYLEWFYSTDGTAGRGSQWGLAQLTVNGFFSGNSFFSNVQRATTASSFSTVANTIKPNQWQLIAVTYNEAEGVRGWIGDLAVAMAEVAYDNANAPQTVGVGATTAQADLYFNNRGAAATSARGGTGGLFALYDQKLTVSQLEAIRRAGPRALFAPRVHVIPRGIASAFAPDLSGGAHTVVVTGTSAPSRGLPTRIRYVRPRSETQRVAGAAAFQQLVARLDPNNTGAAYYFNINHTLAAGKVVSVGDALSRANVPALAGVGSPLPAWDATNGITFDGAQNALDSGTWGGFGFDQGPLTIIYLGTVVSTGFSTLAIHEDTNASRFTVLGRGGGANYVVRHGFLSGTPTPTADTGIAADASPHAFVLEVTETGADAPGRGWWGVTPLPQPRTMYQSIRSTTNTVDASGLNHLEIGRVTGLSYAAETCRGVIVLRRELTDIDYAALQAYLTANEPLVLPVGTAPATLVWTGDSLGQGFLSSDPPTKSPIALVAAGGAIPGYTWKNWSVAGYDAFLWSQQWRTRVLSDYRATRTAAWCVIELGSNDIGSGGRTDTQTIALLQDVGARARAQGYKVAMVTIIKRGDWAGGSTQDNYRLAVNTWITGSAVAGGYADVVLDPTTAPNLADPTNTTYYNGDQLHLTDAGYQAYADAISPALAAAASTANLSGAPSLARWTAAAAIAVKGAITAAASLARWTSAGAIAAKDTITASPSLPRWSSTGTLTTGVAGARNVSGAPALARWTAAVAIAVKDAIAAAASLPRWTSAAVLVNGTLQPANGLRATLTAYQRVAATLVINGVVVMPVFPTPIRVSASNVLELQQLRDVLAAAGLTIDTATVTVAIVERFGGSILLASTPVSAIGSAGTYRVTLPKTVAFQVGTWYLARFSATATSSGAPVDYYEELLLVGAAHP